MALLENVLLAKKRTRKEGKGKSECTNGDMDKIVSRNKRKRELCVCVCG